MVSPDNRLGDKAIDELQDAKESTVELHSLYDADSIQLRMLYNWCCAMWGNKDTRLIELGFVQRKHHGGGQPDAPTGLACDVETKTFSWDETHLATSYQLAYRKYVAPDPEKKLPKLDWEEAYAGADTSVVFDPGAGDWEFKVRARNKHGFGDFSEVITVNFNGGALAVPTGFKFDEAEQKFFWDKVTDAETYQLEISRDGGQTWIPKYDGVDNKFDGSHLDPGKALARVRAVNPQEISEWSGSLLAWIGVPNVPGNLRWHPEEYHGDMFAKIEWDIAGGATNYQLHCINDGEFFNTGTNTFQYEDIMDSPGEHEYKVRAENGYGWSEFSPVLVFVLA